MFRNDRNGRAGSDRASLYDDITSKIIAELEAGRFPWVQPWGSASVKVPLAMPRNAATGRHYSGINVLILWGAVIQHGFPGQSWLTFRQALSLGGNVRRGERGTTVVYADRFTPEDEKRRARDAGEEAAAIPFLKRFTVFNAAQCDGLPEDVAIVSPPPPPVLIEPQVEALIRATSIDFRIGGDRAFYVPALDYVQVPPPQAYFEPINWHRTALHELGHATGHPSRLNRDFSGSFGSKKYAFEELVAEINAAFCCASLGITPTVRHADYIGSWLELCSPHHNSSYPQQPIMRRNVTRLAKVRGFWPRSSALFQSVSSQARTLVSRFHEDRRPRSSIWTHHIEATKAIAGRACTSKKDFMRMAALPHQMQGRFILSINDREVVCELFADFHIEPVKTTYTLSSKGVKKVAAGPNPDCTVYDSDGRAMGTLAGEVTPLISFDSASRPRRGYSAHVVILPPMRNRRAHQGIQRPV